MTENIPADEAPADAEAHARVAVKLVEDQTTDDAEAHGKFSKF